MKAFMSAVREYDCCPCPINTHYYLGTSGTLGDTCVQDAEQEARRILAETEPGIERAIIAGEASRTPLCAQPDSIKVRLAESLAAFIAADLS